MCGRDTWVPHMQFRMRLHSYAKVASADDVNTHPHDHCNFFLSPAVLSINAGRFTAADYRVQTQMNVRLVHAFKTPMLQDY